MQMAYGENQWGRWMTPDLLGLPAQAGGDITNPQSLNRYAYALNNPTTLTDPSGLGPCPSINGMPTICITSNADGDGDGDGNTPPGLGGGIGECPSFGCVPNCSIFTCGPMPGQPGGGGGGGGRGGAPAPKPAPPATGPVVPSNPCQYQGRALAPSDYATAGKQASGSTVNFTLDVTMGFPAGHYLDPQPLASGNVFQRQAYGNYTFGVYMAAAGVSRSTALSGANAYAFFFSRYPQGTTWDTNYGSLPAASVANISNGYNAQMNGTVCHK